MFEGYRFFMQQTRFLSDYSDRVRAECERQYESERLRVKAIKAKTLKPAKIESIVESPENPTQLFFNFEVQSPEA